MMDAGSETWISPAETFVRRFGGGSAGKDYIPVLVDRDYSLHFFQDYRFQEVIQYHRKFQVRFEKNVKHRQQVELVRKYLRKDTLWLDAPIGSGRMMDELPLGRQIGFDGSPAFLEFNRAKGRTVIEGDLLDFPFSNDFDLITTIHTLPAFTCYKSILASLVRALRPGGTLIVDINNARHLSARRAAGHAPDGGGGMNRREILSFFSGLGCQVLEIHPHDYFDSPFISRFYGRTLYRIANRLYFLLRLYPLLDLFSRGRQEHMYTKFLLVVRKEKNLSFAASAAASPFRG